MLVSWSLVIAVGFILPLIQKSRLLSMGMVKLVNGVALHGTGARNQSTDLERIGSGAIECGGGRRMPWHPEYADRPAPKGKGRSHRDGPAVSEL